MAITYPLTLPSDPGYRSSNWSLQSAVGIVESGFDFKQQVQQFSGQRWVVSATYPVMNAENAGKIKAFLAKLYGRRGTFLMGDITRALPQGSAQYALENLLTYSEQQDNAIWSKIRCSITANDTNAPDGSATADKIVEDSTAANDHHLRYLNISVTSGVQYRFSFWAKADERTWVKCLLGTQGFGNTNCHFDLTNGVVGSAGADVDSISIQAYSNGWYRCTGVATADTTTGSNQPRIYIAEGDNDDTYDGDGVSGLHVWGAQFSRADSSTEYVKTEATSSPLMSPLVNGASQTGNDLITDGWAKNQSTLFKAGDWLQLGSSGSSQLYMVVEDVSSDTSGNATFTIVPELRSSPADDAVITYQSCKGLFRLQRNITPLCTTSGVDLSRVGFTAVEVL